MNLSQILIRPVLTEKSVHQEVNGKYTFEVHHDASKVDIKNALKALYGVHVDAVNVTHILAKNRLGRGCQCAPFESGHHHQGRSRDAENW